jgi:hypothetical protein
VSCGERVVGGGLGAMCVARKRWVRRRKRVARVREGRKGECMVWWGGWLVGGDEEGNA